MEKIKMYTVFGLAIALTIIFLAFEYRIPKHQSDDLSYAVENRWELPSELQEVSGIAWLGNEKIAAIQDEDGIIFVYNLNERKIEKKINFAKPGDYEGVAIDHTDAFVMRSDGTLFAIYNFERDERKIKSFKTGFTEQNNIETLEFDKKGKRLLLIPKDHDINSSAFKGVYAFLLAEKKMVSEPILKISMTDKVLQRYRENDLEKTFRPSDMAIHPETKKMYVLEGVKPKLLIIDDKGKAQRGYKFDKSLFRQPEGITFSDDGRLFISSEGKKDSHGSITEIKLND